MINNNNNNNKQGVNHFLTLFRLLDVSFLWQFETIRTLTWKYLRPEFVSELLMHILAEN
jgi:hypothetical protein